MATITTTMTESFIHELCQGTHNLSSDTYKIALIKSGHSGSYGKETENYSDLTGNSDEVANGSGYTTGGLTLSSVTLTKDDENSVTHVTCDDPTWSSASFSTVGAVIYSTTQGNKVVCVLDLGGVRTTSTGTFRIDVSNPGVTGFLRFPLA